MRQWFRWQSEMKIRFFLSQSAEFYFAKHRFSFRKEQISFLFASFHKAQYIELALCAKAMHFDSNRINDKYCVIIPCKWNKEQPKIWPLFPRHTWNNVHQTASFKSCVIIYSAYQITNARRQRLSNHVIVSKAEELSSRKTDHWFPSDRSITEGKSARFGNRPWKLEGMYMS